VASGEAVALIAPSGRGKTTLLRVLAGLEAPSGGHVRVAAYELAGLKPRELDEYRRRVVGYVRQQPESGLWPHLSALRNVQVPMLGDGWTAAERTARAQRLLTAMGIGGRQHHRPGHLPGAARTRLAAAVALANQPLLLLMDEPAGELDRPEAHELLTDVLGLARGQGTAVVVASHDLEVERYVDRLISLDGDPSERGATPRWMR